MNNLVLGVFQYCLVNTKNSQTITLDYTPLFLQKYKPLFFFKKKNFSIFNIYDILLNMIKIPCKIPITINLSFFALVLFIAISNGSNFVGVATWTIVILISLFVHELGHAFTAIAFGHKVNIEFFTLGGITHKHGRPLALWKEILVNIAGPIASLLLYLIASFLLINIKGQNFFTSAIHITMLVNIFWSIINLAPIIPLDGGILFKTIMENILGLKGRKVYFIVSIISSIVLAIILVMNKAFLMSMLLFLFIFENYQIWKQADEITEFDEDDQLKDILQQGYDEQKAGHNVNALNKFQEIRKRISKGAIYISATVHMAEILLKQHSKKIALDLLLPIKDKIPPEALPLLHRLAFYNKDYNLIKEISGKCYRLNPLPETAFINAMAYGYLSDVRLVISWLECSIRDGTNITQEYLRADAFNNVRDDILFIKFEQTLKK